MKTVKIQAQKWTQTTPQRWLGLGRAEPLFDSLFVFENYPADAVLRSGARALTRIHYPLVIAAGPGHEIELLACYSESHFDATTIEAWLDRLRAWLETFVTDPTRRLSDLGIGGPERNESAARPAQPLPAPATEKHSAAGAGIHCHAAPRDRLERDLAAIWEDLLGRTPIGIRDDFFELGGHSLIAVRLFGRMKEHFGVELSLATIVDSPTVEALAQKLREAQKAPSWSPVVSFPPIAGGRPFFCVHPAGGSVLCYAELSRRLGSDWSFYGLRARGLEACTVPQERVEEMAATYLDAIRDIQPKGPYLLGGFSFGGLVAFEMAQMLFRKREPVAFLALIDTMAGPPPCPDERAIQSVCSGEFFPRGTDERKRHVAVFAAHVRAMCAYTPVHYPGRVALFRAAEVGPGVAGADWPPLAGEPDLGWSRPVRSGLEVHEVPGNHFSMLSEPHVRMLAEKLRERLKTAL